MHYMRSLLNCHSLWHFLNELSLVVTFSHIMYFRTYAMHKSMQKLTQIMPLSHCSWHIHSHMNAFTQICNKSNPNWIVTVYDILNNLSPNVTFSHIMHFMTYTMLQSIQNLIQIIPPSQTSWHFHSHMNAFTQICITCNPNWIVTVCDILNILSPVVTFSHMYFRTYTMHQSMQKLTQIIHPSHCSWHKHSHMNAFTQICIKCNLNRTVTVHDILNKLSPVVTFWIIIHFRNYTLHQSL